MTLRIASCSCGQLQARTEAEPLRVGVCHCLACQRRTGSVYGAQARFPRSAVTITGSATEYLRAGDEGGRARSASVRSVATRSGTRWMETKTRLQFPWARLPIRLFRDRPSRSTKSACSPGSSCPATSSTCDEREGVMTPAIDRRRLRGGQAGACRGAKLDIAPRQPSRARRPYGRCDSSLTER